MITGPDMHRRALGVLRGLEAKIKDGTASEAERSRYSAGCDHVLIYEWAGDSRPAVELVPREPEEEAPPREPEAIAFAEWYTRARSAWAGRDYLEALLWWWGDRPRVGLLGVEADVEAELMERGLLEAPDQERAA